jgi:hypothetical protein
VTHLRPFFCLRTPSPALKKDLRYGYKEMAMPVREAESKSREPWRRRVALVNVAFGHTPEEIELLCATGTPRTSEF